MPVPGSAAHAGDLIRRHQRFGDTYFRVPELIRISPAAFARLSDAGRIRTQLSQARTTGLARYAADKFHKLTRTLESSQQVPCWPPQIVDSPLVGQAFSLSGLFSRAPQPNR